MQDGGIEEAMKIPSDKIVVLQHKKQIRSMARFNVFTITRFVLEDIVIACIIFFFAIVVFYGTSPLVNGEIEIGYLNAFSDLIADLDTPRKRHRYPGQGYEYKISEFMFFIPIAVISSLLMPLLWCHLVSYFKVKMILRQLTGYVSTLAFVSIALGILFRILELDYMGTLFLILAGYYLAHALRFVYKHRGIFRRGDNEI